MKKRNFGLRALALILFAFALIGTTVWAFKNACPDCSAVIEDLELTACPKCAKVINKCLICGTINPIKNDNCFNCNASLAESRILRTIDKDTREDLRLGESDRARIEVELGQIKDRIAKDELTAALAAREVELLTKMDWWSKANLKAIEFGKRFADSDEKLLVSACRAKALRNLGFLAYEDNDFALAIEYLNAALAISPKDKKASNLLKMAIAEETEK